MIRLVKSLLLLALLLAASQSPAQDLSALKWETNDTDPPIGSPAAKRGGTFTMGISTYPLTFRLQGPNSNDMFANWNQAYASSIGLVDKHPTTGNYIPILATHWSVQDDHKTIYFKLDPDARWSDGQPITADDYVFAREFLSSPLIADPFQNKRMEDYFESIEKVDGYTIKIVGKQPSWRPLVDYNIFPVPKHSTKLDGEWIKRENYKSPVVQGPYTISSFSEGRSVEFTRITNWWGDKKRYFTGMFNPDKFVLKVILDDDQEFDYFKKGEIDFYQVSSARRWATQMEFDALKKGWAHRKRIFLDTPQGIGGIVLNLKTPLFQNKDFRKGLQYLLNFEELNKNIMFNAYYRSVSFFEGTEYENENLTGYPFDPRKAREHLTKAGFSKRGRDGILVDDNGNRASFNLNYSTKSFEPHLTVLKNTFQKGGVEVNLQLLDPGAAFEKALEKSFQAQIINMTAGFYPDPHQYFSSEFKDVKQNNNFWGYGNPEVDKLINVYRFDMDFAKRKEAMDRLDEILTDEAILIQFWQAPFVRILYLDGVEFPEYFYPRRSDNFLEYQIFWINQEKKARLQEAMKSGTPLTEDTVVDVDPYGVQKALEEKRAAAKPGS